MKDSKRDRLEDAGWRVGNAAEFLGLSEAEVALLDMRAALGRRVKRRRADANLTQAEVAAIMGSSQSRVARIEAGDPTVSIELMIRAMLSLGADRETIAAGIAGRVG